MLRYNYSRRRWPLTLALTAVAGLSFLFAGQAYLQSSTAPPPIYNDVTDTVHRDNIAQLKAAGVLDGTECGPDQFCPGEPLKRRTFAVWMVRVLEGDQAPGFVDPAVGGQSPFADVGPNEPEALFIKRLSELGVTAGCATEPLRYCPDEYVSRSQMASFLSRAFKLSAAADAGFADVAANSVHWDNINRLAAAKITVGCKAEPKRYCPQSSTTRGQMASFLARAIAWQDDQQPDEGPVGPGEITITVTGADNSTRLQVSYDESTNQATASWQPSTQVQADYYVLQWRRVWEDFNSELQQVVDADDLKPGRYSFLIPHSFNVYAVRVISVRGATATIGAEVKVDSQAHQLRKLIKERIIDVYGGDHPWLEDTWRHMNSPKFDFAVSGNMGPPARVYGGGGWASSLVVKPFVLDYFDNYQGTIIHELGHVYTLTNGINENSGVVGIGYLYFHLLELNYSGDDPSKCIDTEFYADIGRILFYGFEFDPVVGTRDGGGGDYWSGCSLNLSPSEIATIKRDAVDVARAAFYEQEMPDWFYRNYQKADGNIDLDKLWANINTREEGRWDRITITYHLRDEFGGFCSSEEVGQYLRGEIDDPGQPWRDGGC